MKTTRETCLNGLLLQKAPFLSKRVVDNALFSILTAALIVLVLTAG